MTRNIVAAHASATAREIGTKLLIGNFNGLPVVDNNIKLIGIVTAIDIFRAIKQGRNLDNLRAIEIMTKNPMAVKQESQLVHKSQETMTLLSSMRFLCFPSASSSTHAGGL
jgi:CBS domain-containing protein